jgi:tetratricopeptide (TPR) repeat protein
MKSTGKTTISVKKKASSREEKQSFLRKYRLALLVLVPFAVYLNVVTLQYTCLDDTTFILDNREYNQNASNLFTSFERGLFQPADKSQYDYYRPLFLVDMIVEYHIFGENATGYHVTNLLFHILSVVLLFLFFKKIKLDETTSLILALLFAVHPALSQAVAWIPGRNDMMLMIFLLAGMLFTIDFAQLRRWQDFVLQMLFFLLALFTKETAIIIPILAFFLLTRVFRIPWKQLYPLGIGWAMAIFFWFFMESTVKQSGNKLPFREMLESGMSRMPAFLQYLGKIFLPVNLSVHPQIDEISIIWGLLSVGMIIALLIFSKSYFKPLTILGIGWFLLFLLPVLAVPRTFNDLVYEHRLYIPMVGILLLLSQTFLFSGKLKGIYRDVLFGTIILLFGAMSFSRVGYFKNPLAYWNRAVVETPQNAYSKMMTATWVKDDALQEKLFREAYAIDSTMKDINLYLGKVSFKNKNYADAERHLKKELAISKVKIPDNYFFLGQIAYEQKDYKNARKFMSEGLRISGNNNPSAYFLIAQACFFENLLDSAAINLLKVIELDPADSQANNNLVLLYMQLGQKDKAVAQIQRMKANGVKTSPELLKMVGTE